mmetsp:Transcript_14898/g.60758  ORF Transcript_14898/g.60758 Transcript_14898/m.60758 type:complete len:189 (-) Transcript_14898:818-1384(-)
MDLNKALRTCQMLPRIGQRRSMSSRLTHIGKDGKPQMVDVGSKAPSTRTAVASAKVLLGPDVYRLVEESELGLGKMKKGSVLSTAQLAGIIGAKKTADLIPLCHPVPLTHVGLEFELLKEDHSLSIVSSASTANAQTGVEMEALSSVSIAALTVYDMCKAASKGIIISDIKLLRKTGGKSGDYTRTND